MASLASINIVFDVGLRDLSTDLQNSIREVRKWGDAMQDVGKNMSLYITAPILAAAGASTKFASDMEESQNKVDVAFKDSSAEVDMFAKSTLKNFGIAEGSALDMAAGFGDMATGMAIPQDEAAKMSKSLVGLAGDLASFKNKDIGQVTTALNGIFTGETESLKMLGIVMTEANLQAFALSQGITKNVKDLTQAEKVQLRYAYVMSQTTNAQGDFMRTGGGAANQTRVLQEGLKELGVMFGEVILPAFTAVVKAINEVIGGIKQMDPATRNMVVAFAGVAAAIGPVVYGIGSMARAYTNFLATWKIGQAALLANPFTALAVALGAIAAYALVTTSRFTALTDAQEEMNKVRAEGVQGIASEKAALESNLSTARNKALSDEKREKAIKNLNAMSPEFLGNITLETVNTDAAKEATDRYTASLLKKATAQAAYNKLVEVQGKLEAINSGELVDPSVWQNISDALLSFGNSATYSQNKVQTMVKNTIAERSELEKLQKSLMATIEANGGLETSNAALVKSAAAVVGIMPGTIKFYEGLIADLKKTQTEATTTADAYAKLQLQIDKYQEKIDALQGKRKPVEAILPTLQRESSMDLSDPVKRAAALQVEVEAMKKVQEAYAKTDERYKWLQQQIDNKELLIKMNVDPASIIQTNGALATVVTAAEAQSERFKAVASEFNAGLTAIMESTAENFAVGFGEVLGNMASGTEGMRGIWNLMLSTVGDLAIQLGKMAIGIGLAVEGIKKALQSLNPVVAVAAGVALVALGTVVKNQLKGMGGGFAGSFADGGMVGGSSYYGDKLWARVNSGEMILNQQQQRNVMNMINPAASAGDMVVKLMGGFEIEGTKLKLVLDRTDKQDNRTK